MALFLESYLAELESEMFDRISQTIRGWIKSGQLRGYLLNNRKYRVTRAALEEYQEGQRNGSHPEDPGEDVDLGPGVKSFPGSE